MKNLKQFPMKGLLILSLLILGLATTVFSQNCTTFETKYKTTISISKKDSTERTTHSTKPQLFSIVEYKADFLITMLDETTLKYKTYYCYFADNEEGVYYLVNANSKDYTTIYIYDNNAVLIWNRLTNHKTWYYETKIPKEL